MHDINAWLDTLGLGQYAEVFAANDIDIEILPELVEADLEKLGVSMAASMAHSRRRFKATQ